jgi:hypothetical protein
VQLWILTCFLQFNLSKYAGKISVWSNGACPKGRCA